MSARPRAKAVLRYRADRWCLALAGAVLLGQLALFFLAPGLGWAALGIAALFPLQSVAIACVHNHHHKPTFTVEGLNRLYEIVLFLETGLPAYLMTLHHNLGHHHHYLTPERDTLCWRRDGGDLGFAAYMWVNVLGVFPYTVALGRRYPAVFRKLRRWLLPALLPLAALIVLDPLRALVVFLLPMAPTPSTPCASATTTTPAWTPATP